MRVTMNWAKIATLTAALTLLPGLAEAQQAVKIGLGAPTLSFLPIWSGRALDTFKPQGLTATVAALPGGDASALAALDAGDIDMAAVGPDSMLRRRLRPPAQRRRGRWSPRGADSPHTGGAPRP